MDYVEGRTRPSREEILPPTDAELARVGQRSPRIERIIDAILEAAELPLFRR
jgi:hypothetical protein